MAKNSSWIADRRWALMIWSGGMLAVRPSLAEAIMAFAPLVVVPMGLRLVDAAEPNVRPELRSLSGERLRFVAAILLIVAMAFPQGGLAGALVAPWLLATYSLAIGAASRRLQNLRDLSHSAGFDYALIFMTIGSTFALFSRLGIRVNDFSHEIILLTGVHFHYAGFVLPVMAALIARRLPGALSQAILWGCLGFTVLLAVGINSSPQLEIVSVVGLVVSTVVLAFVQITIGWHSRQPHSLAMLGISSLSLLGAMGMATAYAFSEFYEAKWVTIPTMIPIHGMANAFGFCYCGLWGWEPLLRSRRM